MDAITILETLDKELPVSRWDCFAHRSELRRLLKEDKYIHLHDTVELLIDTAIESL